MKLIEFGTITKNERGGLTFSGFAVDCENDQVTPNEALILLAIERLHRALTEVRGPQAVGDTSAGGGQA